MEALKQQFTRPLTAGAVGGMVLDYQMPGADFTVSGGVPLIGGQTYSPMVVGAALGFATSFITEALNNILHAVDKKDSLKSFPSFITHVGGSMGSWMLLPKLVGEIDNRSSKSLAVSGLAAEIISQWVFENFMAEGSFGQDILDLI